MKKLFYYIWFVIFWCGIASVVGTIRGSDPTTIRKANLNSEDCTDVARGPETLMVFATLEGGLTAIDPITSEIRWKIADDPPILANQKSNIKSMQYFPNPRDGSIYQMGNMGHLTKMRYTIPELVANSPCRSRDGILYSGKKSDTWYIVDPKTGQREKVLGFGDTVESNEELREKIDWARSRGIYLGRTQYTVIMRDSQTPINKKIKPWNITFYDYYSHSTTPELERDYEYIHLTTTTNGKLATLDRKNGRYLWENNLGSPIVSAFLLGPDGLLSVPFTILSDEVFDTILKESKTGNVNAVHLFESLYVGISDTGLYALPSLVDRNTPRLSVLPPVKLLDGNIFATPPDDDILNIENNSISDVIEDKRIAVVLGHYDVPTVDSSRMLATPTCKTDVHDLATIYKFGNGIAAINDEPKIGVDIGTQTDVPPDSASNTTNRTRRALIVGSYQLSQIAYDWIFEHPNKLNHLLIGFMTAIIAILSVIALNWLHLKKERYSSTGSTSSAFASTDVVISNLIDLGNGEKRVGKIAFNESELLGSGTAGTAVFKGKFERRTVAVKRLLPELFNLAEREVTLLGESDTHENVVRYFCTEQDLQYRYIAVELCQATLEEYTVGENSESLQQQITVFEVMLQSSIGLSHLHSLSIVHRDIKPHNVLISFPDVGGKARVMISDFGLSKKLTIGELSASNVSGVTGTYGWLAPEMQLKKKFTTAVDVYSLGCVYFYILSNGRMFENENSDLIKFLNNDGVADNKKVLAEQLITQMLNENPDKRPPARSICNHPLLWSEAKMLSFLEDVSDRVEPLHYFVEPLRSLETNSAYVIRNGWLDFVDECVKEEMNGRRGYQTLSVKHLLRAVRNKKHHYEELKPEAKELLGSLPHGYVNYWITRFPHLISHVYHACSMWSDVDGFKSYYDKDFKYPCPSYLKCNDELPVQFLDSIQLVAKRSPMKEKTNKERPVRQNKGQYNFKRQKWNEDKQESSGLYRNVQPVICSEFTAPVKETSQREFTVKKLHNKVSNNSKKISIE